jgi:circadian clock protein KaiC
LIVSLPAGRIPTLQKAPSGIDGLDEITDGGLPRSRTTLVCGGAGCGKTLMALQFLVRGALDHGDPGVFMSFEESATALAENVGSLGWDLTDLVERDLLVVDRVNVRPGEIIESGEWDLDGLMLRIGAAIDAVGAKRVVLDTVEVLFGVLLDEELLRAELRRLFDWLSGRGVTAIVTGESGGQSLTRHGLEEYVSDCVVLLDQRIIDQSATRRLRISKYRGSTHGSDEYPFLIDDRGLSVLPATSMALKHTVSTERVSLGVQELDRMLSGGPYRGTSVFVVGNPGAGKSTLAASYLDATCRSGRRGMYFSFEESADQIARNMASVGLDLRRWQDPEQDLLRIVSTRPAAYGLERHLAEILREIAAFEPHDVVIDPVSALTGERYETAGMLARLVDHMKTIGTTTMFTALVREPNVESATMGISSIVDTWIELSNHLESGERNRAVSVVKSRGMRHSAELREFRFSSQGFEILPSYQSGGKLLMGTAAAAARRASARRRATIEAQIDALRKSLADEVEEESNQTPGSGLPGETSRREERVS